MSTPDHVDSLRTHYDVLWASAAPVVRAGGATLDAMALGKTGDGRRGLTLLARPAPSVVDRLTAFLERLRALEPAQYYQPRTDFHHTILSLFTATVDHRPYLAHRRLYEEAVADAVAAAPPFEITVRGVTLSTGAVLAQGFPRGEALDALRERLRGALVARGLGSELDQRYRLVTAHMTVVRFTTPLRDAARFVEALTQARTTDFGVSQITRLELVLGDWYHSAEREQTLSTYSLQSQSRQPGTAPASCER